MKCPVCPETNLVMSERQGIEIDYCPSCRGVWLDRGELDKIVERSAQQEAPAPPPQQQAYQQPPPQQHYGHYADKDHYKHGHGHHYKKKKSFFEELFD
ncbi:MAG: zf-TFIIB domain-containing protein [Trichlorobacter sp.]|uniref:TFIIB-type zinc ribbon-containing protein n=1 Tax=Trichlorobacter sp. TaxID=2911007 RepID=UPI00255EFD97|nr:zf-TFIIB domain-containing protein [Trichlorobacter sp.]MDK9717087.1 zf-TFIIB domain-containing protein [Trichlorobacter sp.]